MLVLVTGATGFLGRRVVSELQEHRHQVRCLVHTLGRERIFSPRSVDVHYGSVLDPDALSGAFYDVGAVVHLVGAIRQRGRLTYDRINRQSAANAVAAIKENRENRVKHFLLVSAIGAGPNPSYPYLHSKWQGEQEVLNSGLPHTILRSSIIFGEGDEFLNNLAALVRVFPIVPVIGSGRNRLQPIAVEDLAHCIALSVDREELKGKTLELGGPQQLSYNEIVEVVSRTLGKRRLMVHAPVWLSYVAASVLQGLLPRAPVTTDQLRMLSIRNVAEPGVVEETFGFTPRSVEGNIDYVKQVRIRDGLNILSGHMPPRIRDH